MVSPERQPAATTSSLLTPAPGDVWYFAYGSNLSVDRKVERTGAIRQAVPCRLPGYRFAFNKRASAGGAYGNIVPDPSGEVWGVAYLCNPQAMKELDSYEGVATGHYEQVPVNLTTRSGETIQAVTYVAGADFLVAGARPADSYVRLILSGARHHGLPEDYIASIEAEARITTPKTAESPAPGSSPTAHDGPRTLHQGPPSIEAEARVATPSPAGPAARDSSPTTADGVRSTEHGARTTTSGPLTTHIEDPSASGGADSPLTARRIDELDTDEAMAAFRQASRGRGWMDRDELLKGVSLVLGYQRLGPRIEEALRNHLRAAIRRRIIEADGPSLVRAGTGTMADCDLEELRETFCSVMRKGTHYEREDVIHALARYLGFARVTDTSRDAIKSAINSAIRHELLGYEGSVIWRED